MAIGKKISLSQIIGLEGEDEVKLWLLKSCNIVATKVANDFGVDFIGQRRGAPTGTSNSWFMSPLPISIAVRATTLKNGKIRLKKADAKVLLDNPYIFLVIPHFSKVTHKIYVKFVDRRFIDELNAFIDSKEDQKTISVANCIDDIQEINKQLELLLSPAHAEEIKMYKIKTGLIKISATGQITIHHRDGDSYALIETKHFSELFSGADDKLKRNVIWGGQKYQRKYLEDFNASRKFKESFVEYLHSLPVTQAVLIGSDEMFQEIGPVTCKICSLELGEAECEFRLRASDGWVGLWHPIGVSIIARTKPLPDGTPIHEIETHLDGNLTITDIEEHESFWKFLLLCRDEDSIFSWGEKLKIPIRVIPELYNLGIFILAYQEMKQIHDSIFPASTLLNEITDDDLKGLSWLSIMRAPESVEEFEVNLTGETPKKVPVKNISLPLAFNILGKGIICWMKREGFLLFNDQEKAIGIHLTSYFGYTLELREEAFVISVPFVAISKQWPPIEILANGHAKFLDATLPDGLCMKTDKAL